MPHPHSTTFAGQEKPTWGEAGRGRLRGAGQNCHPSCPHQIGYLATRWSEGKPLCIFVKYFTKILKVKYFITFYKEFYRQQKVFHMFDYSLHANKYVKIGKHFKIYIFYFKTYRTLTVNFYFCISFSWICYGQPKAWLGEPIFIQWKKKGEPIFF